MTSNPDGFESFDSFSAEQLEAAQAVANAHQKLLVARKRDFVLGDEAIQGSYRYANFAKGRETGVTDDYWRLTLVPPYDQLPTAKITQLQIVIPTKPIDAANEHLIGAYHATVQGSLPDVYMDPAFNSPRYVPTADIFGSAHDKDGNVMNFLLNANGLRAFADKTDIKPAEAFRNQVGQYYDIEDSLTTHELQTAMHDLWFDTERLENMLRDYDPIVSSGRSSSGAAA